MYISLGLISALVAAAEGYAVPAGHAYQDPKTITGAVRSPCPVSLLAHSFQTCTYVLL